MLAARSVILFSTPRLYVRTWLESDFPAFFRILSDPLVNRFTAGPPSQQAVLEFVEQAALTRYGMNPGYFNCPIILKEYNCLIGRVGLNPYTMEQPEQAFSDKPGSGLQVPEIEWTIASDFWGKGLATEAGRATLRYGFEIAGFDRILGMVDPENTASLRVMEKIGMRSCGLQPFRGENALFFELLHGEWLLKNGA